MTTVVLLAVLGAAVMHGAWNAIAKAIPDRLVSSSLIGLVYLVAGGIGCLLLPFPNAAAWPSILISVALQTAYLILLTAAYAHSDFGVAYPLTRGLAVLGVTALAVGVLGEHLTTWQFVGVAIVVGALAALALLRRGGTSRRGLLLSLAVAACITGYSFTDGIGVRASGSALGYAAWLSLLQGIVIPVCCVLLARDRRAFVAGLRRSAPVGAVGGVLSLVAYTIVVWAQSVAPLALVSALRETGVIAAGLIGMLVFREKPGWVGVLATVAAAAGIVAIHLAG